MNALDELFERLPKVVRVLVLLAAAVSLGWGGHVLFAAQYGLPARVSANEVLLRDSLVLQRLPSRVRALELHADSNRFDHRRLTFLVDSIARNSCLMLAEVRDTPWEPCLRNVVDRNGGRGVP